MFLKTLSTTKIAAFAMVTMAVAAQATPTLTVRASGTLVAGVGPIMQVRVDDSPIGSVEVRANTPTDYVFSAATLKAGAKVEVVFTNGAKVNDQVRSLAVAYLHDGSQTVLPYAPGIVFDRGFGLKAFDGLDTIAGQSQLNASGALRLAWPAATAAAAPTAEQQDAARLLQQASFGPTTSEIARVVSKGQRAWINEQLAMPQSASFVPAVQRLYDLGDEYRPGGARFSPNMVAQRFWKSAATSPDQLRKRVAFALHQIIMVSEFDSNFWGHIRAYAQYLDTLDRHAFGNYRNLLEEMALSPAMGIYLSHMRNRRENAAIGVLPDENFAREVMQLFSIGLHELNEDGTPQRDATGRPIETYTNADVMAMARVFTGWSWGFQDDQLTDRNFRYGRPDLSVAADQRIDLRRMKPYPGQHSTAEKVLFAGKPWALTIPADTPAVDSLRMALDALFNHPNVGPFIARQLIQRLVTSNPSPGYVRRVAAAFNDNGKGVRGDLAAVVRTILLDSEARGTPAAGFGKVREPALRVAHWMRAFGAKSASGDYMNGVELAAVSQRALFAPSVFGYFRPGYVPPGTQMAANDATAPEFQIVDESTTAGWVNLAQTMVGAGLGPNAGKRDVTSALSPQVAMLAAGNVDGLIQNLNLLLFAGRMSRALQQDILDAVAGVGGSDAASQLNRARVAVFVALSSPEYLVQR